MRDVVSIPSLPIRLFAILDCVDAEYIPGFLRKSDALIADTQAELSRLNAFQFS